MSALADQQCKPLESSASPLSHKKSEHYIKQLDSDWILSDNDKTICRTFKFKNYYETMAFVNTVAMVAHQQDHHPDMVISYNSCNITYSTHSIDGLSENDFICAAKIDKTLNL